MRIGSSSVQCEMKSGSLSSWIILEKMLSEKMTAGAELAPVRPRSVLSAPRNRDRGSQLRGRNRQNLLVTPVSSPSYESFPYVETAATRRDSAEAEREEDDHKCNFTPR